MKTREKFKNLSKMKKTAVVLAFMFLMSGSVYAVWTFAFTSADNVYEISSSRPLEITENFGIEAIDVTNNSYEQNRTITLSNSDGVRTVTLETTIQKDYVYNVSECDPSGDEEYVLHYEGNTYGIDSNDSITVPSGLSYMIQEFTLKKQSCPGNLTTTLSLFD